MDGTLIEAWASQKSFQKKDGGDDDPGQFRGQTRGNETHESKTDPDAQLYRKGSGQEAKLGYLGDVLMENRQGLIVDAMLTHADGVAERDACLLMTYRRWRKRRPQQRNQPMSVGADKAYDTRDGVIQMAAKLASQSLKRISSPCCYGIRPKKSATQALRAKPATGVTVSSWMRTFRATLTAPTEAC